MSSIHPCLRSSPRKHAPRLSTVFVLPLDRDAHRRSTEANFDRSETETSGWVSGKSTTTR